MKRTWIIYILMAVAFLMIAGACTPPPENPKDDEPDIVADPGTPPDGDGAVVDPAVDTNGNGSEDEGITSTTEPGEGEVVIDDEPIIEEPSDEPVEEEVTGEVMTFPDNLFGSYESWPPDSITPEEVEILNHALVVFETTKGLIKVKLFPEQAPLHSANCVKLVQDGFYDGLKFHRVMSNFMSQGGDPEGTGSGGPGYTIPAEIGLPHVEGSMAAARTGGVDPRTGLEINPEKRSSGSQFYFVHTNTSANFLDGNYTVYGQIYEGIDVNLSLSVNYSDRGPIPGAATDSIIRAWVEYM